ncbi:hypothetical protein DYBT9275_04074 [Dyadobacter sp. CECT 9275]|uniref:Uncharacterized protein n=2 Tax=Dyadobacter helix TaxID=2822344 RepID=A0A916JFT8_9BACT|nr:hypothetical protein DYBT9275_04074 [Dyadobacter sp. CECT 9275]
MKVPNTFPRNYSNPEWCPIQIYRKGDTIVLKLNKYHVPLSPGAGNAMESEDHPILGKVILHFHPIANVVFVSLFGEVIRFNEDTCLN